MALQSENRGAGSIWISALKGGTYIYFVGVCCWTPSAAIAFTSAGADGKSAPHRVWLFSGKYSL